MSPFAPVVVFAYRRPDHLRNTLTSLMRCERFERSPVIVYCDGPRDKSETDAVMAARETVRTMLGAHAECHFSEVNLGLSRAVIAGVSDVVNRFGRAIVIEDNLEPSPAFLTFMNQALDHYANDESIFQVSGYIFDVPELRAELTALFLPFTMSWGWATWKRAWDQFDPLVNGWEVLQTDKSLRRRFNLNGAYDYATMLERQMRGAIDSWAVRWYWTVFKANGLVLFPPVSLVRNTGFDGSGTHGRGVLWRSVFLTPMANDPCISFNMPSATAIDTDKYDWVIKVLRHKHYGWLRLLVGHVRRLLHM